MCNVPPFYRGIKENKSYYIFLSIDFKRNKMHKNQFDVNFAGGFAVDVAKNVLPA